MKSFFLQKIFREITTCFLMLFFLFNLHGFSINGQAISLTISNNLELNVQSSGNTGSNRGGNTGGNSVTEDPCKIAFCLPGISNNPRYQNASLTPGQRAAAIIGDIAGFLTGIVLSLAVIYIVYAGFQMLNANGDSNKYKNALNSIAYTIVGMFVAVVAYGIVASIINFIAGR
jgi:type IV secretory pathway VirB2 component (pilin)